MSPVILNWNETAQALSHSPVIPYFGQCSPITGLLLWCLQVRKSELLKINLVHFLKTKSNTEWLDEIAGKNYTHETNTVSVQAQSVYVKHVKEKGSYAVFVGCTENKPFVKSTPSSSSFT